MKRYLGIDLHKNCFTVCYLTDNGSYRLQTFTLSLNGIEAFKQSLTKTDEVAVESTGNTGYFVRSIESYVLSVKVINPAQFKIIASSVKKTDENDAVVIARYLSKGFIPEVRMKSKHDAQITSLISTRDKFIKLRTVLKNKIHALCNANGIVTPQEAFTSNKGLNAVLAHTLDDADMFELRVIVAQIRSLNESIALIDKELSDRGKTLAGHTAITSITGIGNINGAILLNTIGNVSDFSDDKKLVAYFGMAPRVYISNETSHYGRITKMGNKIARTALVQSAWVAIKYSPYLRSFYERLKAKKGSGKAIIATARKLLTIIYKTLKNNWVFEDFNSYKLVQEKNTIYLSPA